MKKTLLFAAVALLASACCGGSSSDDTSSTGTTTTTSPVAPTPSTVPTTPTPGMPTPGMPTPGMPTPGTPTPAAVPDISAGANFGTVTLATGFVPDPTTANGTAGGQMQAMSLNQDCRGWIATRPDHLFVAQTAFSNLRIMARANADTDDITLVVRRPDGTFACNDDSDGLNPLVAGAFAPGTYQIWVGSYHQGQSPGYRLGLSEIPSVTPSSLAN